MTSVFSKIIQGELPSHKIAENDSFLAFLDITPLYEGHTLVIPKVEVDNIFDLDSNTYRDLWSFAQNTASAVGKAIPCKKVGVAVIGLEVPHAHIHLVPINNVSDIDFSKEKLKVSQEELAQTAERIKSFL